MITAGLLLGVVRCAPEYTFEEDDDASARGGAGGDDCAPGTAECDGDPAQSCETKILTNTDHCGECGARCELAGAEPRCSGGNCLVASCIEPFENCNARSNDGCEVNLTTDAQHCGGCGNSCSKLNGTPTCDSGACLIACDDGWDDCNDDRADGCERPTASDTLNCGECGNVCQPEPGETPFCASAECGSTLCKPGLGDCNGDGNCEQDLNSDAMNCGSCGNPCVVTNGVGRCDEGVCVVDSCDPGYADCDEDGKGGGFVTGCEANVLDSVEHCGGCDEACVVPNGRADCANGQCRVSTCISPFGDCDGDGTSCETDTSKDGNNCGACADAGGLNCATEFGAVHADGVCTDAECTFDGCQTSFLDCDEDQFACEVDRRVDRANCGACNVTCATPTGTMANECANAACKPTCEAGYENCDRDPANGCEDIQSSTQNCGACNSPCQTAGTIRNPCSSGECNPSCLPDRGDCDGKGHNGCETTLTSNPLHCGACDVECETPAGTTSNSCANGACVPACGGLYGNCDRRGENGCETSLGGNNLHCGACDRACQSGGDSHATSNTCSAQGECVPRCQDGWSACSSPELGCTTSLDSANNCGACGKKCGGATPNCVEQTCQAKIAILDEADGGIWGNGTITLNANLIAGTNRFLLVVVTARVPPNGTVSQARPDSVVYGGLPMVPFHEFDAGPVPSTSDGQNHFFSYYLRESDLAALGPGAKQLGVRGDAPSPTFMVAEAILFSGVRQTDSISSAVGRTVNVTCQTTQPSATIAVTTRGSVVYSMAAAQYPGGATAVSPLTRVLEFDYRPNQSQSTTFVQGGHLGINAELQAGNVTAAWHYTYCAISTVYDVAIQPAQAP